MTGAEIATIHGISVSSTPEALGELSEVLMDDYRQDVVNRTMEELGLDPTSTGWHNARFAAGKAVDIVLADMQLHEPIEQDVTNEGVS